jgi:plant G-box-binding factor
LHAGVSSRTSTRRTDKMNGKDKDVHSLPRDDLYLKQGQQTDLPEASELRRRTVIDNGKMLSSFCSSHFLS